MHFLCLLHHVEPRPPAVERVGRESFHRHPAHIRSLCPLLQHQVPAGWPSVSEPFQERACQRQGLFRHAPQIHSSEPCSCRHREERQRLRMEQLVRIRESRR